MSTPASRVRERHDPALAPPPRIKPASGPIKRITMRVGKREYPIGVNVEGETPWEFTIDGAATVTLPVRSPDDSLLTVLSDENLMQEDGIRITLAGVVYVLVAVESDETRLYTLTFEDEVAWRLRHYSRFLVADRKTITRAGFIKRMCDEAGVRSFIPEIGDTQRTLTPTGASA